MINVSALLFRAAAECQSTEETRYYLNGVYIQPHPNGGALLVATDGHRLFVAHDVGGTCDKAAIVAIDKAVFTKKTLQFENNEAPRISVNDDGIASVGTYRSVKSAVIDGVFPDYRAALKPILAMAKKKQFAPASFNQIYLAAFGKIGSMLLEGYKGTSICVSSFTASDPALVRFNGINHAFGVLMPMRGDTISELPAFMKPILGAADSPMPVAKKSRTSPTKKNTKAMAAEIAAP